MTTAQAALLERLRQEGASLKQTVADLQSLVAEMPTATRQAKIALLERPALLARVRELEREITFLQALWDDEPETPGPTKAELVAVKRALLGLGRGGR